MINFAFENKLNKVKYLLKTWPYESLTLTHACALFNHDLGMNLKTSLRPTGFPLRVKKFSKILKIFFKSHLRELKNGAVPRAILGHCLSFEFHTFGDIQTSSLKVWKYNTKFWIYQLS